MLIHDTHSRYGWAIRTLDKLGPRQMDAIETAPSLAVSAMTCWEMAWLVSHGRIALQLPVSDWLDRIEAWGVAIIPVSRAIAERAVSCLNITKTRLSTSSSPRPLNIKHNGSVWMDDSRNIWNWPGYWYRNKCGVSVIVPGKVMGNWLWHQAGFMKTGV